MFRMIRPGKFKHRLLSIDFLHSATMRTAIVQIQAAHNLWREKRISSAEWTALYVFILSAYRRPRDFFGGPHNEELVFRGGAQASIEGHLQVRDLQVFFPQRLKFFELYPPDANFLALFCAHSLRSIPLSVQKSIALWIQNDCLRLCEHIPSSFEVLEMQCQGLRCVSVLTEPTRMQNFVEEGRDVLGFVVHDLIHADHFFRDPAQARAQIAFSQRLEKLHTLPVIQERLRSDIEFMGEWNYLISDMNSVPLHLFKTLKAIALASIKRQYGILFKSPLQGVSEQHFDELMQALSRPFHFSEDQHLAWNKINTPEFQLPADAHHLEQALIP